MTGKNVGGKAVTEKPILKTAEERVAVAQKAQQAKDQAKENAAAIVKPSEREAQAQAEQQRRDAKIQQGRIPVMAGVSKKYIPDLDAYIETTPASARSYIEANTAANENRRDASRTVDSFYPNQSIGVPSIPISEAIQSISPQGPGSDAFLRPGGGLTNPNLSVERSPARVAPGEAIDTWFDTPNTKPASYQLYAGDSPSTRNELAQRLLLESMTGRVQRGGGAFFTPVKGVALDEDQLAEVRRQVSEITGNPDRIFTTKAGNAGIRKHPWSDPRNMYLSDARKGVALSPPFKRGEAPTPGVVRQVAPVYDEDIWGIGTAGSPGVGSSFPTPNPDGRGMTFKVPPSAKPSPGFEGESVGFPNFAEPDMSIAEAITLGLPKPDSLDTRATRAFEQAGPGAKIAFKGFDKRKQDLANQGLSIIERQGYGEPGELSQQVMGFTDSNGRLQSKIPINNITATTDLGGMTPGSTVFAGRLWANPAGASTEGLRDREARLTHRINERLKNGGELVDGRLPPGTQGINLQNGQSIDVFPRNFTDMGVRGNTNGWTSQRQLLAEINSSPDNGALYVDGMPGGKGRVFEYYDEYGGVLPGRSDDYDSLGTSDLSDVVGDNTERLQRTYGSIADAEKVSDLTSAYWEDGGMGASGRQMQEIEDILRLGGRYVRGGADGGKTFVPLTGQEFENYRKLVDSGSSAAYSRLKKSSRDPSEVVTAVSTNLIPNSRQALMGSSGLRELEDASNWATTVLAQQAENSWQRPTPALKPVMNSSDVEGVESKRDRPAQSRFAGTPGYVAPEMRNLNPTEGEEALFDLLNKTFTGRDPSEMTRPISETQPLTVGRMGTLVNDRREDVVGPRVAGQRPNTLDQLRDLDPDLFELFNQPVVGFNATNVLPDGKEVAPPDFPDILKHGVYLGGPDQTVGEFIGLPGKSPYDRATDYYGLTSTVPATDNQAGGVSDGGYIENLGNPQQINRTQQKINPVTGEIVKADRTDITGKTYIEGVRDLEKIAEENRRLLRAATEQEFLGGKVYKDYFDRPMAPHQDFLDADGVPLHQKLLAEDRAMSLPARPTLYDFSKLVHERAQPGAREFNLYQDNPAEGDIDRQFRALPENLLLQAYATKEMNNRAKKARSIADAYATGTYKDPGDARMAFSVLTENGPQTVVKTLSPEKYVEIADTLRTSGPPLIQTKPRLSWEITDRLEAVHDLLASGQITRAEYETQVQILTNGLVQEPQSTVDFRVPIDQAVETLPSPEQVGQAFPGVDRSRQVPTGGPMMRVADDYTTQYVGETANSGRQGGQSVTQIPGWKNYLFDDQIQQYGDPTGQGLPDNNLVTPSRDLPASLSARKGKTPRTPEQAERDRLDAEEADRAAEARLKALEDAKARRAQQQQVARWQR
jgi:hypothetical protein